MEAPEEEQKKCRICAQTKPVSQFPANGVYKSRLYYEKYQAQTRMYASYCCICARLINTFRKRSSRGIYISPEEIRVLYPTLQDAPAWLQSAVHNKIQMKRTSRVGGARK